MEYSILIHSDCCKFIGCILRLIQRNKEDNNISRLHSAPTYKKTCCIAKELESTSLHYRHLLDIRSIYRQITYFGLWPMWDNDR